MSVQYMLAFDETGNREALVNWGKGNPDKLYKLFVQTMGRKLRSWLSRNSVSEILRLASFVAKILIIVGIFYIHRAKYRVNIPKLL